MQSDYRAVSRNISLQRLNLARIIIILVLLLELAWPGRELRRELVFARMIQCK